MYRLLCGFKTARVDSRVRKTPKGAVHRLLSGVKMTLKDARIRKVPKSGVKRYISLPAGKSRERRRHKKNVVFGRKWCAEYVQESICYVVCV